MIHANRVVTVGDQESIINKPIVLYRGDREVEIEFELVGNEFMFTTEGNVIKSVNASHGQLVLNTPSGDNMFSTLVECHDGKIIFIITKDMIDEFVEVGFYSFQIRLYDSAEMKSRVTIPPVMNGFDIRNPIAAEDEVNVVDQGLVDYARIFKDQSNEELPAFTWEGAYNKTEWAHHDVITENKMNKIEDAISSITDRINGSDIVILKKAEDIEKQHQNDMDELNAKDTQLTNDIQTINSTLTNEINKVRVDMEVKDIQLTNEINKVIMDKNAIVSTVDGKIAAVDGKIAAVEADMETRIESIDGKILEVESDVSLINDDILLATISEELTNNSVTSFKVGTSNVTGVDLSNQMEQSIVSLDNIEGASVRIDVDNDYIKTINCITLGDLELKSLPNGTKDTYSNGIYTKKINRVYFKDLNWSHYSDGATGTKTTIYKADIPDMATCGEASSTNYNFTCSRYDLVSANTQWITDEECMSMCPSSKGVYLRVSKTSITDASAIKQYIGFHYMDYELESPIEEMRELNFLCKPNDVIDTKSPIPFTCSHTVQLNTKSQIEEAQKQIIKNNKSIWQRLKTLTDVEFKIGQIGYIKLPTILGGLLIQWGRTSIEFTNEQYKTTYVEYPMPFKTDIYFQTCNMFNACTEAYYTNTSIVYEDLYRGKIYVYGMNGNMSCNIMVYYVAIGK